MRTPLVLVTGLALVSACGNKSEAPPPEAAPAPAGAPAPSDYDALVRAARSYNDSGRPGRGVEVASRAAAAAPDKPEAFVVWGRALAMQNKLPEAAIKYEEARSKKSQDRQLYTDLSSVYDVSEQYDKALGVYREWLSQHPDDAEMQQELGLTLLLLERFDEARDALAVVVRAHPDDMQARQDLGYALLRGQHLDEASRELEVVLNADPRRAEALRLLAQVRAASKKTDEALALLDRAIAAEPGDPRALRVRARLKQLRGDAAGALADYTAVLQREGDDVGAALGMVGALATLNRLDEAQKLLTQVQQKAGDGDEVRLRTAQIAWRRGDKAGLATLRELAKAQPHNAEIWREVKLAAEKLGDKAAVAEADKQLKRL